MIDPEDITTFDDGYYEDLSEVNQEDFEEEFESNLAPISSQSIERQLRSEYDEDLEHFDLIRAACGCFHPGGGAASAESDFQFAGTNPLVDIEKTPADVALVKEEYNCVTIEMICCEIGGEERGQWVEHINAVHEFLSRSEVRNQLKQVLGISDRDLEIGYITLVREDDAVGLDFSVLESSCNAESYAIWECDSGDRCIRHVDGQLNHPDLEAIFDGEVDYLRRDQSLYVAVGSHPIIGLKEAIFRTIKQNQEFGSEDIDEFNRDQFEDHYETLFTVMCGSGSRNDLIEAEVNRHLMTAEHSQILTQDRERRNTNQDYRVVYSGTRGPQYAQDAVEPRYFDNMPLYLKGKRAYEKTKEEFDPSTELSDF